MKILIILSLFLSLNLFGAPASPHELKVLSWNIQMLPAFIFPKTQKQVRSKAIGKLLNEINHYDVIVFQEAFKHMSYLTIKKILKKNYPYQFGPANRRYVSIITNSGVMILSKYPAKKLKEMKFRYCDTLDDCMARKGGLLIEVEKNGQRYHVGGTHMNAGGNPNVRIHQAVDLKNMFDEFEEAGVPQILAGDFNIEKGTELYDQAIYNLGMQDGPLSGPWQYTVDWQVNDYYRFFNGGTEQSVIDYLLINSQGVEIDSVSRKIPDLRSPKWSKKFPGIENLSDHLPVEITISHR